MGEEVEQQSFTREDRTRYREKVRACLDVLERMLVQSRFDADQPATGLEIELNLVDEDEEPALRNMEVLEALGDPDFQTELGQFNLEINVAPKRLVDQGLSAFVEGVRNSLNAAEAAANDVGARLVMVGILPTLTERHLQRDVLSGNPRYQLLSDEILAARGEDIVLDIDGPERLRVTADSIAPEAACTSTQLHVQVSPEEFPAYWNASQAISSLQLAVGANSPYLLGHELWRETRIALFEQATDTRAEELKAQGVRPRVWFGERWITSLFDLFEENVRYFPSLLPVLSDEDPAAVLEAGGTPQLDELRLHNGTIYRWNRPVYAVVDDTPHVRVENRVLPAGPTVIDTVANAAFYFGLVRTLAEQDRPVWSQMSFTAAEENFHAAARNGLDARVYWPGVGQVPASELVVRRLLPLAAEGLDCWGVDAEQAGELLDIIERRCVTGRNGASWMVDQVGARAGEGDRHEVLRRVLRDYRERMHENQPVHEWD
ncbi:glutamate--cysteine ligase [Nocardioides caldifontis]|uniref:glutamate--cysteine ligase n=1 Tax=Nocardioides caldifontis TaxID=2588938 RepID=UPI0011DFB45A|nr:glutamate--cysteine ligase [Nocardioides caldifontis]